MTNCKKLQFEIRFVIRTQNVKTKLLHFSKFLVKSKKFLLAKTELQNSKALKMRNYFHHSSWPFICPPTTSISSSTLCSLNRMRSHTNYLRLYCTVAEENITVLLENPKWSRKRKHGNFCFHISSPPFFLFFSALEKQNHLRSSGRKIKIQKNGFNFQGFVYKFCRLFNIAIAFFAAFYVGTFQVSNLVSFFFHVYFSRLYLVEY